MKEFYRGLGEVIANIRKNKNIEKASIEITRVFNKAGILQDQSKIILKGLGRGRRATAYLISGNFDGSDKYVIKVFHEVNTPEYEHFYGNHIEAGMRMFWLKNAGENTQVARFYFADVKNGFMISHYIDPWMGPPDNVIPPEKFGLRFADIYPEISKNITHGNIFDPCIEIVHQLLVKNTTARKIYGRIFDAKSPEEKDKLWDEIYKKEGKHKDVLLGLTCAIEQFTNPEKYFKLLAKISNNSVKLALANNFYILPTGNENVECFKLIANNATNDIKEVLVGNIRILPKDKKVECFELLEKNADDDFKMVLKEYLFLLPENRRNEMKTKYNL